ncbi:luciferase family oxidoreductase group 1 [Allonocardiopsis opalescens]|uniref:Luciferase family oxidoreductase group 1 n=1 Tax=Allonocardiopsis opalescens TaxID=1144618 RepID=A0A2T0PXK9_9ACTN|nr:luciferase family oxidoreductase group 1 [Allonocardiopsis opalescens]
MLDYVITPPEVTATQALAEVVEVARTVERLGYKRIWFSEHHNSIGLACTAPELVIGRVAAATSTLRVGAGGIMLPNHAPLKVAEMFQTLEAMFPGRIDLGLGRAPGTDGVTALALRRSREAVLGDDFAALADELFAFFTGGFPDDHPFASITVAPQVPELPQLWMLGSSDYGARYAAEHGLPYAFAQQINPDAATAMLTLYRRDFTPSRFAERPRSSFSVIAFASDDAAEAEDFAAYWTLTMSKMRSNRRTPTSMADAREFQGAPGYAAAREAMGPRLFTGTPSQIGNRLRRLAEAGAADEVMIATPHPELAARERSFELLAKEFGLG